MGDKAAKRRARNNPPSQRPKIDARLALLLSLPRGARRELKARDDARTDRLIERHRSIVEKINRRENADRERDQEELQELERHVVAPLTCGLFIPGSGRRITDIDEEFVSALVWSEASSRDLEQLGVRVRSQVSDVFSTFLPLSAIRRLERSPAIRYIELGRPLFPTLDHAIPETHINVLHNTMPAVDGTGVIVGIYDNYSLDFYHDDFRTTAGRTRVLFLWDQSLSPTSGEAGPPQDPVLPGFTPQGGPTYGVEYDDVAINNEIASFPPAYLTVRHASVTGKEHGTHVTGIAAGNGRALNGMYVGAAPAADIIYVKSPNLFDTGVLADTTYMADAFSYIFARAAKLGRPCVVNMSISDDQGPHDGSRAGEHLLDDLLLLPGRAITLSAGNSNNTRSHAAGNLSTVNPANLQISYTAGAKEDDVIEIWYDGHDRFDVTVTLPTMPATVIGPVAPGGMDSATSSGGAIQVTVDSKINDPRNGDNVISVTFIVNPGREIPIGDTTISLNGTTVINGAFHAWVDRNNRAQSGFNAPFLLEDETTMGVPATARRPLTVGNHLRVVNTAGIGGPGAIAVESGRGPTRDGRIKPEIATFGTGIMTANSKDRNSNAPFTPYIPKAGTSMSAPLVGGVCALLFQCRGPTSTWANLKQILLDTAVPATPQNGFGYGYMQAQSACTAPLPNVDVWLRDDATDAGAEPFTGPVAWLSPDIQVLDRAGAPAANPTYSAVQRFNNIIRVMVRNRGTQPAVNTEVFLYWADPATHIPYPSAWNATGIYTGSPNFVQQGNGIAIPQIPAGGSTSVDFAFAPPVPGSSIRGDDHFCLLVRLENVGDPSRIAAGGWSAVTASNNVGLKNVHVQPAIGGSSTMRFYVVGSAEQDSVTIYAEEFDAAIDLVIPVQALPWRDMKLIDKAKRRRLPFGHDDGSDPLVLMKLVLEGSDIRLMTDILGAERLSLGDGLATLTLGTERRLHVPHVRIAEGAKLIANIRVSNCKEGATRSLHVAQHSGGQLIGGVTLELRTPERP